MAFLLLAGFVVLNMLVGVVVENFQKCRDIIEKDRMAEKEKEREKRSQSGKLITYIVHDDCLLTSNSLKRITYRAGSCRFFPFVKP